MALFFSAQKTNGELKQQFKDTKEKLKETEKELEESVRKQLYIEEKLEASAAKTEEKKRKPASKKVRFYSIPHLTKKKEVIPSNPW